MNLLTKENIGLLILGLLLLSKVYDFAMPNEGVTADDINRIIKLKESDNRQKQLEQDYKLIIQRDEIIAKNVNIDSIIIWDADRKYRDSLRAITNPE